MPISKKLDISSNKVSSSKSNIYSSILLFAVYLLFTLICISSVNAMTQQMLPLSTSVNQYYSISYDEEGEATVNSIIDIQNYDEDSISNIFIEFPSDGVIIYNVFQEVKMTKDNTCVSWDTRCVKYMTSERCIQYDLNGACVSYQRQCENYERYCLAYSDSMNQDSYPNNIFKTTYQKLNYTLQRLSNSVSIKLSLYSNVEFGTKTRILISYKELNSAKNNLGKFSYSFTSLKFPYQTSYVREAVSVQDGLFLAGTNSKINYKSDFAVLSKMAEAQSDTIFKNTQYLDDYSRTVMSASGKVKSASNLDPYESLTVKGDYSNNYIRLHSFAFLTIALISSVLLILFLRSRKHKISGKKIVEKNQKKESSQWLSIFLLSVITSAILISLTFILGLIGYVISRMAPYQIGTMASLFLSIFSILVWLAGMIGVSVYAGQKYFPLASIIVVILNSVFTSLFIGIIVTIVFLMTQARIVY